MTDANEAKIRAEVETVLPILLVAVLQGRLPWRKAERVSSDAQCEQHAPL